MLEPRLYRVLKKRARDAEPSERTRGAWVLDPASLFGSPSDKNSNHSSLGSSDVSFLVPPSKSPNKRKVPLYSACHGDDEHEDANSGKGAGGYDEVDAEAYLARKYFESLYLIKMPLYYFPKTLLSRLESIFLRSGRGGNATDAEKKAPQQPSHKEESKKEEGQKKQKEKLKQLIRTSIISIDKFDQRHNTPAVSENMPGGVLSSAYSNPAEEQYRSDFSIENKILKLLQLKVEHLRKRFSSTSGSSRDSRNSEKSRVSKLEKSINEVIGNYLLLLKIRETQIQVLLLLEYLYLDISDIKDSKKLVDPSETVRPSGTSDGSSTTTSTTPATSLGFMGLPTSSKRTLIRPRRLKGKKGAPPSHSSSESKQPSTTNGFNITSDVYYRNLLNTHLDRLLIWDIIVESRASSKSTDNDKDVAASLDQPLKEPISSGISDDSEDILAAANTEIFDNGLIQVKGFVKKVVIPYFYHKAPQLMRFIKNKVSGELVSTSYRKTRKTGEKGTGKVAGRSVLNAESAGLVPLAEEIERNKTIKRSKTEADVSRGEQNGSFKEQASSLRSKSIANKLTLEKSKEPLSASGLVLAGSNKSLRKSTSVSSYQGITKMLSKREIDFSVKKKSVTEKLKLANLSNPKSNSVAQRSSGVLKKARSLVDSNLVSANKAKKVTKSFSQIEATPVKDHNSNPYLNGSVIINSDTKSNTRYNSTLGASASRTHSLKRQFSQLSSIDSESVNSPSNSNTMNISPSIIDSPSSSIRITNKLYNYDTPTHGSSARFQAVVSPNLDNEAASTSNSFFATNVSNTSFLADWNGSPTNVSRIPSVAEDGANTENDDENDSFILDLSEEEDEAHLKLKEQLLRR